MSDIFDDWESERELAPEGAPEALVHLALTCNGGWGLSIKDAVQMRQHMDGGKPPLGDSTWKHELEQQLPSQLHPDVHAIARRIAWAAYRQGILHGELLAKHQKP
jgi:hypothetical protein